jgi:hypothetical protein
MGGGLSCSGVVRPRWSRICRMETWSVRKAIIFIFWPQRVQTSGSVWYDLVSHCTPRSGFGQLWLILLW